MSVIPFKNISISTAYSLLLNTIPGLDITIDYTTPSLVVYGSKTSVEAAIQLGARLDGQLDVVLEIYPLKKELPTEVISALPRIERLATATYDRANQRIFIFGKQAAVDRVKAYLAMIESSTSSEQDGVFYLGVERDVPAPSRLRETRRTRRRNHHDSGSRRFRDDRHASRTARRVELLVGAVQNLPRKTKRDSISSTNRSPTA